MRRSYRDETARLSAAIDEFISSNRSLPGIVDPLQKSVFIDQLIDSQQRVAYFDLLQKRALDPQSVDPSSARFDPLRAALIHRDAGDFDEACWLVFLFTHFGKHRRAGWRYISDIYGKLGSSGLWDWASTSADPTLFRFWLDENQEALVAGTGPRGFGNHRKYESLNAWQPTGTGEAFESYISWVFETGEDHKARFAEAVAGDPESGFETLFKSMARVTRFGRIARFDYLMTLGRLDLVKISPPHSYLVGSTGPLIGARLLLEGEVAAASPKELQDMLSEFGDATGLTPDVLEDAVCNWQKSPTRYVRFSG